MVEPNSASEFLIRSTRDGVIMQLPPRLTVLEAINFKQACQQVLQNDPPPEQIFLDWSKTTFIDSSGVGALVTNVKATRSRQVNLISQHVHPQVMAVFSMTGLDKILQIQSIEISPELASTLALDTQLPETHPSVRSWVKRAIDILGGTVGLLITGILFVPIALAIKINSRGPIFFGQTRCGWLGRKFTMWKFRSMYADAESRKSEIQNQASGAFFKNDNDPRITKVGKFLRRTSLDELPQFWNVVRGDMSLVGTRPPTPDEVERYEVPAWQRLDVRPGMTGEWQVYGRSRIRNFEDVIELDLRYQRNWSLRYDIKLILRTILLLFNRNSGAV
jgi:anti-anti-sigma factor